MIFANIMQDKEKGGEYWSKLLHKYRFVIMNDDSFEEKISLRFSRINILVFSAFFIFISFFGTLLLIAYTPISEYLPGKSSTEVQKNLIKLSLKSDSIESILLKRSVYLKNMNNIIRGNELITPDEVSTPSYIQEEEIIFANSKEDSLLRVLVETEDKGSIHIEKYSSNDYLMFFSPISGVISSGYNIDSKHFGIDLVAKEKERISSVLDGTVIISHWTSETGYVIAIQHKNDYLSLYKHNSLLLKEVGDFVSAGDHVAVIGNSGELSSGPHLHFELWHKGMPVNPENYITF
tara:strand:+ start:357 stop:1232 length:876 start_codon:yes stop_codon:yes gene_type:complete